MPHTKVDGSLYVGFKKNRTGSSTLTRLAWSLDQAGGRIPSLSKYIPNIIDEEVN